MKKLFLFLFVFSVNYCLAETYNPFLSLFRSYFPNTYSNDKTLNLRQFIGDTIYFDIEGNQNLTNVFIEQPDTVWIKDKKSKKPKEGKDFLLSYNYKGIRDGNSKKFYTRASDVNEKLFGLLSVKELKKEKSFYLETVGFELTLVDPETADIVYVILDSSIPTNWKLYSLKANDIKKIGRGCNSIEKMITGPK